MPYQSRPLFHLFVNSRILYDTPVDRDSNSFVVHRALSHPGFFHGALLLTAVQWAWSTGDLEAIRIPYLYHKVQAIRYVNEVLEHTEIALDDGTIAAVSSLALAENAMGCIHNTASHLRGLAKIKEMQGQIPPPKMGLLQRMIVMAARCLSSQPVRDVIDLCRTDSVHQSLIISLLGVALRPIYNVFGGSDDESEPFSEILAKESCHLQTDDCGSVATHLRNIDNSRSGFIACYLYLYVILREDAVDPFALHFFVEQLLADVYRTEESMQNGQYSQQLWLWTVLFGACAITTARTTSPLEGEQMKALRDAYMEKISFVSQMLGIKTWEEAKSALRQFAWEDGFDGEEELRIIWTEALWDNSEAKPCFDLDPIDPRLVSY